MTARPPGYTALPTGMRVGDFVIDCAIGAGGFGITYLVMHEPLKKRFALKEYFPREFAYRDGASVRATETSAQTFAWGLSRFLDEARTLAKFRHPAIVDVAHVFEANGTAYMALTYEQGLTLRSWIDALGRPATQSEIDNLVGPLLDALQLVHAAGLLHRDIAPDNILVRDDGTPVLLDFGAARGDLQQRPGPVTAIVKSGYSPHEQYSNDAGRQGPWSDIYAFAATLYQIVSGRPPMDANQRIKSPAAMPSAMTMQGRYRTSFLEAIDWGMRVEPQERPQSVAAWRGRLLAADGVSQIATQRAPSQAAAITAPPKPVIFTKARVIGAAALVTIAVAAMAASTGWRPTRPVPTAKSENTIVASKSEAPIADALRPPAQQKDVELRPPVALSQPTPIDIAIELPKTTYAIGDAFTFTLRAKRDCHFLVFTIDAADKVELHDPNVSGAYMGAPVLKAGEARQIPVPGAPGRAVINSPAGAYELGAVCAKDDLAKLGISEAQLREPAVSGKRSFSFKLDEATKGVRRDEISRILVSYEVK